MGGKKLKRLHGFLFSRSTFSRSVVLEKKFSLLYSSDLHVRSTAISALRSLLRSSLKLNNLEEAYGLGIDAISVCTRSFTFVMMLSRVSVPSLPIKICHDVRKSQTY